MHLRTKAWPVGTKPKCKDQHERPSHRTHLSRRHHSPAAGQWLAARLARKVQPELALYPEDALGFVQETQDAQWQKFCANHPKDAEQKFLQLVAAQLGKADPNATNKDSRTFGTLGVLRHELRDRNARLSLCQFKPEHDLNPDTLARYAKNRLRVVPELVYSPWTTDAHLLETGNSDAKKGQGVAH